jgi:hypothetical protein
MEIFSKKVNGCYFERHGRVGACLKMALHGTAVPVRCYVSRIRFQEYAQCYVDVGVLW